jgi:hypothetical protein
MNLLKTSTQGILELYSNKSVKYYTAESKIQNLGLSDCYNLRLGIFGSVTLGTLGGHN